MNLRVAAAEACKQRAAQQGLANRTVSPAIQAWVAMLAQQMFQ
jgi:hypothetical protein